MSVILSKIKPEKPSSGLRCMGDPPSDENGGSVTKPVVAVRENRPMLLSRRESQVVNDEIRYLSPCWQRVINLIPRVRRSHRYHFPAEEHESRNGRA